MEKLILIKLGGSVITDKGKSFTPRSEVISRLAEEIKEIQKKYKGKIIVGHGQGSYAHIPASKYQTQKGILNTKSIYGFCVTSEMAKRPNTILTQTFLKKGIPAVSFSPMSFEYANNGFLKKMFLDPLVRALDLNMIPIIYGDVVFDKNSLGFCIYSTEATLGFLAEKLGKVYEIEKIIMLGDTDGVYDSKGKTIPQINLPADKASISNYKEIKKSITGSKNVDVTGGMLHKVEKALNLAAKLRIKTVIINGNRSGELGKAIFGRKVAGTEIF